MKDASQFFKVLADEARLKMLWLLLNHKELCVCDIMATLEISQSKASRHLATLRHAGLVTDRKEGLWSFYALRPVKDNLTRAHLRTLQSTLSGRPDAEKLLKKLEEWLERQDRGAQCLDKKPRPTSAKKNKAVPSRKATLKGGNR